MWRTGYKLYADLRHKLRWYFLHWRVTIFNNSRTGVQLPVTAATYSYKTRLLSLTINKVLLPWTKAP